MLMIGVTFPLRMAYADEASSIVNPMPASPLVIIALSIIPVKGMMDAPMVIGIAITKSFFAICLNRIGLVRREEDSFALNLPLFRL